MNESIWVLHREYRERDNSQVREASNERVFESLRWKRWQVRDQQKEAETTREHLKAVNNAKGIEGGENLIRNHLRLSVAFLYRNLLHRLSG